MRVNLFKVKMEDYMQEKLLLLEIANCNQQIRNLKVKAVFYRRRAAFYRKKSEINKELIIMQVQRAEANRQIWSLVMYFTKLLFLILLLFFQSKSGRFWEEEGMHCDENKFREHFRVSRTTFTFLVDGLKGFLQRENTRFRPTISVEKRVAIALYALGSSAEMRTVANCFGVGRSTAGEILHEFCHAICLKYEREFLDFYPPTAAKISEIVEGFETNWGFPQTYGAVGMSYKIIYETVFYSAPFEFRWMSHRS